MTNLKYLNNAVLTQAKYVLNLMGYFTQVFAENAKNSQQG